MPTVTDAPPAAPRRRRVLQGTLVWAAAAAAGLPSLAGAAATPRGLRFVAAWDGEGGEHHLGVLAVAAGALRVVASIELPTRAHGLLVEPGGSVLAAARRPGDWALRWAPTSGAAQWFWNEPDRRHTGHLLRDPAGRWLYSAETDGGTGQGLIAVRDARTFARHAEWPTQGIDPHQFILDADGSLLVANGGVPTRPETGRAKLALDRMDPSLVRLDGRSGALLGQWRLSDPRLSIRHLARDTTGQVGIALQAEHDDAQAKAAAPVLALFDGTALRTADTPQPLAGYGGDIAATASGFRVSAPRAGGVAHWSREGRWAGFTPLAEACSLAATRAGEVWAGGRAQALECGARDEAGERVERVEHDARKTNAAPHPLAINSLRLDNHWIAL